MTPTQIVRLYRKPPRDRRPSEVIAPQFLKTDCEKPDAAPPNAGLSFRTMAPDVFDAVLRPDVLGILITSKCNIECRHCCNDSAPTRDATHSYANVTQLLAAASELASIREIGISGGEPFMYLPLLRSVVRLSVDSGYTASVTTNGFWAKSMVAAQRTMALLRGDGLSAVHISTSEFHREFLDRRIVPQAVRAAIDAGIRPTVNVVSSRDYGLDEVRTELGSMANQVTFVVMPCLPSGRPGKQIADKEFVRELDAPGGDCSHDFKKLAIDQHGNVFPCCSPGGFTAPLRLGNIHEPNSGSKAQAIALPRLLSILHEVGPGFFLPFVRAAYPQDPTLEKFSDKCHLCHVLLSDPKYTAVVHDASEHLFQSLEKSVEKRPLSDRC